MRVLLLWFVFFFTAVLVAIGVAVALFSRQLRRQNRVDADTETAAPLVWLWSPAQAARLHRRLRAASTAVYLPPPVAPSRRQRRAGASSPESTSTDELSRGLRVQATTLDAHLVNASRLPRPVRRQQLRVLQPQIIEVERLATRLLQHRRRVAVTAEVPGPHPMQPTPPEALAAIAGQLDVLEEAHEELVAIERANGLLDPDAVMRQIAAPPPIYAPRVAPRSTRPPTGPPIGAPMPPPAGYPSGPPPSPSSRGPASPPPPTPTPPVGSPRPGRPATGGAPPPVGPRPRGTLPPSPPRPGYSPPTGPPHPGAAPPAPSRPSHQPPPGPTPR